MSRERAGVRPMTRRTFLEMVGVGVAANAGLSILRGPDKAVAAPAEFEAGRTRADRYVTIAGAPDKAVSVPLFSETAPKTNRMARVDMPCVCTDGKYQLEMGTNAVLNGETTQTAQGPRVMPTTWSVRAGEQFRVVGGEYALNASSSNGALEIRVPQIDKDESGSTRANYSVSEVNILGGATGATVTITEAVPGHCLVMSQYGNEVSMTEVKGRRKSGEETSEVRTCVALRADTGACETIRAYKGGGDFKTVAELTNHQ